MLSQYYMELQISNLHERRRRRRRRYPHGRQFIFAIFKITLIITTLLVCYVLRSNRQNFGINWRRIKNNSDGSNYYPRQERRQEQQRDSRQRRADLPQRRNDNLVVDNNRYDYEDEQSWATVTNLFLRELRKKCKNHSDNIRNKQRTVLTTRSIFGSYDDAVTNDDDIGTNMDAGDKNDDDDRHSKKPEGENKENPPSPPDFTYIPSSEPSSSPSSSPSITPSTVPSSFPTGIPTVLPTIYPTDSPSTVPSSVPTATASISPSNFPTTIQPPSPTITSTSAPTLGVTTSQPTSTVVTSSPTCELPPGGGDFGDVASVDSPVIVAFLYEMETDPNAGVSVADDIVPNVEEAVTKSVVRAILGCSPSATADSASDIDSNINSNNTRNLLEERDQHLGRKRRGSNLIRGGDNQNIHNIQMRSIIKESKWKSTSTSDAVPRTSIGDHSSNSNNRILEGTMIGLSSAPADVVEPGSCKTQTENNCNIIGGRMSLYVQGSSSAGVMSSAMSTVDEAMKNGDLLNAHESLRKLSFMGRVDYIVADDDASDDGVDNIGGRGPDDNVVWTPGYVSAIAIGAVALFGSVLMARVLVKVPNDYDSDDSDFDTANFREISNNSSLGISSDDKTVHASNKEMDVIRSDNYRGLEELMGADYVRPYRINSSDDALLNGMHNGIMSDSMDNVMRDELYYDDTMDVHVGDLESFEPRGRVERDGCFDFFDLILDGTSLNTAGRRQNAVDPDDRSHMSELSF